MRPKKNLPKNSNNNPLFDFIANCKRISSLAKDNSLALDAARKCFEAGGNLEEILVKFVSVTNNRADDAACNGILDTIEWLENIVANVGEILVGLGQEVGSVSQTLEQLLSAPLKELLGEKDDGSPS